jgi:protein-L-isoaspartate(D-aspartate) O-methyltransferase
VRRHIARVILALLLFGQLAACAERSGDIDRTQTSRERENPARHPFGRESERESMVRNQILSRGVDDPLVLRAMRRVPRHLFVPEAVRRHAYEDTPLPIGHDQTISQPYIVALMTELLGLEGGDRVLEIGTGSGYQAAVLAEIADSVFTIEIVEPLAVQARETLESLGYHRIQTRVGDGYMGWEEAAPFDGIIVTCAPHDIPPPLLDQLKEGGRLVIPYGASWAQELVLVTKKTGRTERQSILPVRFVPLTGPNAAEQ